MSIPYYSKQTGIQVHDGGGFYVILDKPVVDAMDTELWEVFESVKQKCAEELKIFLDFGEIFYALSPDGDKTYVINFISVGKREEFLS